MVKKRVIPCLDVDRGRVVKGVRFTELRDIGDPVELATTYSRSGADEIVFLDISATVDDRGPMLALVARAAEELDVPFTAGGGIKSLDDARALMEAGADKITLNTAAHADRSLLSRLRDEYGAQAVVCSIDARRDGEVVTHAGRRPRAIDAVSWARTAVQRGAGEILLTSIDADGTRAGYDLALTRAVADAVSVPVIASGGAGSTEHIEEAFAAGAEAALVASIVHESPGRLARLKAELAEAGWPIRN
jgi:imidazole glycerol-phosphate synthase subunit HisF